MTEVNRLICGAHSTETGLKIKNSAIFLSRNTALITVDNSQKNNVAGEFWNAFFPALRAPQTE